jgi:ABC-type transport system involved in multi-copper enzyme maturation permease subunit
MFGALVFDRDPWTWTDFWPSVTVWLQVVGGFCFLGIVLFVLLGWPRFRRQDREGVPRWLRLTFAACAIAGGACYVIAGMFASMTIGREGTDRIGRFALGGYESMLTLAGFFCVLAVGVPFVRGLFALRFRRIYALAKLSFKEAVRRRILYAFAASFLLFLFPTWFLLDTKPEDEVRTYVEIVFTFMALILLIAAARISAFSIPADVKSQTIHTIVTKPVERFEIILGRFLGYLALMTLVLIGFTGASLIYVMRNINDAAAEESVKAREPLYGELRFENTESDKAGVNVGREWDYRSYIMRPTGEVPPQTARWTFPRVPARLAGRDSVRFEYTFDVYRTSKGQEGGADVTCNVRLFSWRFRPGDDVNFRKERGLSPNPKLDDELAEKYGYYEKTVPVTDFHTQAFEVPAGLFKNVNGSDPERTRSSTSASPDLTVRVTCGPYNEQYVGMARHDLYARLDDAKGVDQLGFSLNFFKAAFGLWLLLALVIGLSVVLSSYLSGVISLLAVMTLFCCGLGLPFIQSVALGKNEGGSGPAESMLRIFRREISGATLADSASTTDKIVGIGDDTFRWVVRRVLLIFPDVNRLFLADNVKEGFAVSSEQMFGGDGLLMVVGYLLPWFMLGYYVIRWREIAAPT